MERWNELFLEAMTTFKHTFPAPKGRSEIYSVRTEPDWEAIYAKLEKAQAKYQSDGGRVGWFRKKRRSAADNASVVSEVVGSISAIVPDTVFSTPIFGVVQLLLDAVNKGAEVRVQASEGLDGLIPIFSDVELLLAVYLGDRNIQKASLSLAISTLEAIERLIGFFLSKSSKLLKNLNNVFDVNVRLADLMFRHE
ncbi:hypothetical protein CKAH01_05062 [Colletotrichum kahawae]|uniref:Uncharacterized protein n=1 Tax=Colletotrichum kahawae TaxID=34407 RepID=A0AAD9YH94_COLKA|nr:hypothetical protein CKAH01_05062 [Colletotrichum kahawae]